MGAGAAVVAELTAAGLTVRVYADGRLKVGPAERLTEPIREVIRQNRAAILAELLRPRAQASVPGPALPAASYTMPAMPTLRRLWRERARELLRELAGQDGLGPEDRADAEYYAGIAGLQLEWQACPPDDGRRQWRLGMGGENAKGKDA